MSMFARSTANMIAGEHAASASTMPVPTGTRPTRTLNDTNIAAIKTVDNANVCDWSSPSDAQKEPGTQIHQRPAPRVARILVQRVVAEPLALPGGRQIAGVEEKRWTGGNTEQMARGRHPRRADRPR